MNDLNINYDFSDLSDQPSEVQKRFEPVTRVGVSSGPSEDMLLVARIVNGAPNGMALDSKKVLVLVRRAKALLPTDELPETTVRGWLNRCVGAGLIAKATGKTGFCSNESPNKATEEELAERRALMAKAAAAKAEKAKSEPAPAEAPAIEAEPSVDPLAALGL